MVMSAVSNTSGPGRQISLVRADFFGFSGQVEVRKLLVPKLSCLAHPNPPNLFTPQSFREASAKHPQSICKDHKRKASTKHPQPSFFSPVIGLNRCKCPCAMDTMQRTKRRAQKGLQVMALCTLGVWLLGFSRLTAARDLFSSLGCLG